MLQIPKYRLILLALMIVSMCYVTYAQMPNHKDINVTWAPSDTTLGQPPADFYILEGEQIAEDGSTSAFSVDEIDALTYSAQYRYKTLVRFRVAGVCTFTTQDDNGEWITLRIPGGWSPFSNWYGDCIEPGAVIDAPIILGY